MRHGKGHEKLANLSGLYGSGHFVGHNGNFCEVQPSVHFGSNGDFSANRLFHHAAPRSCLGEPGDCNHHFRDWSDPATNTSILEDEWIGSSRRDYSLQNVTTSRQKQSSQSSRRIDA